MNPFDHEPRINITELQYARIFARQEGKCAGQCGRKIDLRDKPEVDHEIPLAHGGTNDEGNLQILCGGCHALKTKDDTSGAAHIKRAYAQHVTPAKYRRSRSWGRR